MVNDPNYGDRVRAFGPGRLVQEFIELLSEFSLSDSPANGNVKEKMLLVTNEIRRRLDYFEAEHRDSDLDVVLEGVQFMPPVVNGRPETGAMQFGNDWPGVFVRGDNAAHYAMTLEAVLKSHGEQMHPIMERAVLQGLAKLFSSSTV